MLRNILLLAGGLALGASIGAASANDTLLTGDKTGAYYNDIGPQVIKVLEGKLFHYQLAPGAGTGGNFEQIVAAPYTVGLGQADAYALLDQATPGTVASVPTRVRECAFAVTKNKALVGMRSGEGWGNIMAVANRLRVALPNTKSGSALTWKYIQSFNKALSQVGQVDNYDTTAAALQATANGDADIAFFVQMPDVDNELFRMAQNLQLKWIGVGGRDMLLQTVRTARGAQQVYFLDTVPVAKTWFGFGAPVTVTTACTRVVVMTGDPEHFERGSIEQKHLNEIIATLAGAPEVAFEPDRSGYRSAVASTHSAAEEQPGFLSRVEQASQQSGEALDNMIEEKQQ